MLSVRVISWRAFSGGLALILVGIHMSLMLAFFFSGEGEALPILQSRLWWELSLNAQILCVVLMWITHHDRIMEGRGWKRARAISRLLVAAVSILTPSALMVVSVANDWIYNRPDLEELTVFIGILFLLWLVCAYGIPLILKYVLKRRDFIYLTLPQRTRHSTLMLLLPFILLACLYVMELQRGGYLHVVFWPFLTYIHGAVPYFNRAFCVNEAVSRPDPKHRAPV